MKRALIIFDHPYTFESHRNEPHFRSFSAALCKSILEKLTAQGDRVDLIDLHAEGFDPVMSVNDLRKWRKGELMNEQIRLYQELMLKADRIIFVFPIWWELMPAMTKGFLDKVYAKNILYTQEKDSLFMKTRLKENVKVRVVSTMGTPKLLYRTVMKKPVIHAMQLGFCWKTGIKDFKWKSYAGVDKLSLDNRIQLLEQIEI